MKYLLLASILLAFQTPVAATSDIEEEAAFRFTLARSLAEEGAIDEALEVWEELIDLAPADPYVLVEYARFLSRIGRFSESVSQVEAAIERAPENADILRAAADVFLAAKRVDESNLGRAVGTLEALSRLRPADVQALIDLGRLLLIDVESPDRAAEVFGRAVARQPASRMLQSYLIEALLRAGRGAEAEAALRSFLDTDPGFLRGRLLLANQLNRRGAHHAAAEVLLAGPEAQARDPELRWRLASTMYRTGDLDEGIEILDSLLAQQPDSFKERVLKGMILTAEGRNDAAIEVLERLHDERPDNVEVTRSLVKALERSGLDEEAETLLRRTRRQVESVDAQQVAAWQLELLTHLARVEAWRKLAGEAKPLAEDQRAALHVQGFLMYVEALHQSGRSDRALELIANAENDRIPAHRLRMKEVEILADLERSDESEDRLEALAEAGDLPSMLAAAEVYQRNERYEDAVPVLRRALEQAEDSVHVRYWLAAAYERSGDRESADRAFRALLNLDPNYAPALNYLGYMWAEEGENLAEAVELVDRAVAQEPDNGAYVDSLGWAHFKLGNHDEARELLERASRLLPEDGVIFEHLGDVYSQVGDTSLARSSYRRALELEVDNVEQVRRKLELLPDGR